MKLRNALLAATVLAAPVLAHAEAVNGLYIGAGAGANFLQNETINGISVPAAGNAQLSPGLFAGNRARFDTGFVGLASVGYGLGNGLRVEVEGSYRQNKLNGLGVTRSNGNIFNSGFTRTPGTGAGGDEQKYTGMVNVLYDFDPNVLGLGFFPFPITPYIGVGAGYSWAQYKNVNVYGPGFLFHTNDGSGSFAYQGIVGAAFPIPAVPGLSLTAEYRFLGLSDNRNYRTQFFATLPNGTGLATRANIRANDDYNHSILVGLRYAFNAPPPPAPAPQPAPPVQAGPVRTYLVFFDWDRSDLTGRARQIISQAAQASTRVQTTRIEVNGYTDLSGTARYNQALSVRRANAVAAELVRDGVPRQEIVTRGFGESNPLVPTAQGVREPQNRRVEIILR